MQTNRVRVTLNNSKFVTSLFVYLSQIVSMFNFHFGPQPALIPSCESWEWLLQNIFKYSTVQVILYVKDSDVLMDR